MEYERAAKALQTFQIDLKYFPKTIIEYVKPLSFGVVQHYALCSPTGIVYPLLYQTEGEPRHELNSFVKNKTDILKSCIKIKITNSGYTKEKNGFGIHFYSANLSSNINDSRLHTAYVSYPQNQTLSSPKLNLSTIQSLPYSKCFDQFVCNVNKKGC